jgi:hypothetical protein
MLAGLSILALLGARLVRVDSAALFPLGEGGRYPFWRLAPALPRRIEDGVDQGWQVQRLARREPAAVARSPRLAASLEIGRPVPPTRPQRRIASR